MNPFRFVRNLFRTTDDQWAGLSEALLAPWDWEPGPTSLSDVIFRNLFSRFGPAETASPMHRGAITSIAEETGCSVGYVSRIAKEAGYVTGRRNG